MRPRLVWNDQISPEQDANLRAAIETAVARLKRALTYGADMPSSRYLLAEESVGDLATVLSAIVPYQPPQDRGAAYGTNGDGIAWT